MIAVAWLLGAGIVPPEVGPTGEPDGARVEWLRAHAIPLRTCVARSGFEDLQALKTLIGDARIVALGEPTHGSREVFQMKHRLTEFLASEMGFTIFSIEANMPEAYRVNDYVLSGEGDPEDLIRGMYFWTWRTEEVADMVRWMRTFRESGSGSMEFTGFDMQTPDVAMQIVESYVARVDPDSSPGIAESHAMVREALGRPGASPFGVATAQFPGEAVRGRHVRFAGWIRTEGIDEGYAGLWWRADGHEREVLAFDNMESRGPRGTTDWQQLSIDLDLPAATTNVNFGLIHPGTGKAWFDELTIELDGEAPAEPPFDLGFESGSLAGLWSADSSTYRVAIDRQVRHDGDASLLIEHTGVSGAAGPEEAVLLCQDLRNALEDAREPYTAASSAKDHEWAVQNARVVLQCAQMKANQVQRDESMAANVRWILDRAGPDSRIVLWAHNYHVSRWGQWMGKHLDQAYPGGMVVIGFSTHEGEYTAVSAGGAGLASHTLQPPVEPSFEWHAHATGLPLFLVDLRESAPDDPASAWLTQPMPFGGTIGAMQMDERFDTVDLRAGFDALLHIKRTSASRLLPKDR